MSKDKYPSMFSSQLEAIVFIILQIFFATRAVLKIGEYHWDIPQCSLGNIQSRNPFRPIAREQKYLMDYNWFYYFVVVKDVVPVIFDLFFFFFFLFSTKACVHS